MCAIRRVHCVQGITPNIGADDDQPAQLPDAGDLPDAGIGYEAAAACARRPFTTALPTERGGAGPGVSDGAGIRRDSTAGKWYKRKYPAGDEKFAPGGILCIQERCRTGMRPQEKKAKRVAFHAAGYAGDGRTRKRFLNSMGPMKKKRYTPWRVRVLGGRTAAGRLMQQTWLQLIRQWDRR